METIHFEMAEDIPVIADVDVLVVGGGPGGLGAAVMAARKGAKTMLAERYGMLGGMSAQGEISPFMPSHYVEQEGATPVPLDQPVYPEWVEKMKKYLPPDILERYPDSDKSVVSDLARTISKDIAPMAMEELCLEAGVKILYHHSLVRMIVKNGTVEYAVFNSKSGFVAIRAKAFVDCTGDGDLAVLAGAEFEFGGPTGFCQPMTLCFKLSHVDRKRIPGNINELYDKAKAEGKVHCPRENVLRFNYYDDDVVHFNTTRVIKKSGVNALELSEAELEGHKQFREFFRWLRSDVPGFEKARVRSIASHIGIRETRRIKGIATITRADFERRAKYPDAIVRCNYPIDIHSPTGSGTELIHMTWKEFYEIPYGCVVPKGLNNVTVGGRPVSVDHAVHSSSRVMPPACSLGQAAGIAAALCAQTGPPCPEIDGKLVRQELIKQGAYLK